MADLRTIQYIEVPVGDGWRLDIILDGEGKGNIPLLRSRGWTYSMVQELSAVIDAVAAITVEACSEAEPDPVNTSFHQYKIKCPNCQGEFVMELGDTDYHVPEGGV